MYFEDIYENDILREEFQNSINNDIEELLDNLHNIKEELLEENSEYFETITVDDENYSNLDNFFRKNSEKILKDKIKDNLIKQYGETINSKDEQQIIKIKKDFLKNTIEIVNKIEKTFNKYYNVNIKEIINEQFSELQEYLSNKKNIDNINDEEKINKIIFILKELIKIFKNFIDKDEKIKNIEEQMFEILDDVKFANKQKFEEDKNISEKINNMKKIINKYFEKIENNKDDNNNEEEKDNEEKTDNDNEELYIIKDNKPEILNINEVLKIINPILEETNFEGDNVKNLNLFIKFKDENIKFKSEQIRNLYFNSKINSSNNDKIEHQYPDKIINSNSIIKKKGKYNFVIGDYYLSSIKTYKSMRELIKKGNKITKKMENIISNFSDYRKNIVIFNHDIVTFYNYILDAIKEINIFKNNIDKEFSLEDVNSIFNLIKEINNIYYNNDYQDKNEKCITSKPNFIPKFYLNFFYNMEVSKKNMEEFFSKGNYLSAIKDAYEKYIRILDDLQDLHQELNNYNFSKIYSENIENIENIENFGDYYYSNYFTPNWKRVHTENPTIEEFIKNCENNSKDLYPMLYSFNEVYFINKKTENNKQVFKKGLLG